MKTWNLGCDHTENALFDAGQTELGIPEFVILFLISDNIGDESMGRLNLDCIRCIPVKKAPLHKKAPPFGVHLEQRGGFLMGPKAPKSPKSIGSPLYKKNVDKKAPPFGVHLEQKGGLS